MSNYQFKRRVIDFLNLMKSVKESTFTHTSITEPAGSFYLKYDDMLTFQDLYKDAMKNGCDLFLTEKHRDISPVLIDFDLRFEKDVIERQYTIEIIEQVITMYIEEIKKYVELPDDVNVYLMEKPNPVYVDKKNIVKDGVHIIMSNIVTRPSIQFLVRKSLLKRFDKLLKGMGHTNSIDDVFDEQVIYKNNWQMYGSKKPGNDPYKVTKDMVYNVEKKELTYNELKEDDTEYVEILSIRNKYNENNLKQELKESVVKIDKDMADKAEKKKQKKHVYDNIIQNHESNFKPSCEELNLVKKLINILDPKRSSNYCDWIRLGWCLRNIDISLLAEWDEFSKKSDKYENGACDMLWYRMKEGGLGIGTLHMWAKTDDLNQYNKIVTEDISALIYKSLSLTDYDIALVISRMFRHRFRCASHKHQIWYEFDGHGWKEKEKGYTLFYKEIPTVLFNEYMKAIEKESARARTADDRDRDVCLKNIECLNKISTKLKSTSFVKDKMYKECSGLFYEPKFEEKLDANPKLLGFENGVYDLDNDEFREGRPEDYISMSTGINYIEYDTENPYVEQVDDFMKKVLTNDNVREYVWTLFASMLDGTNRDEKFHIWTGSGCHSYNTKIMMYDGTCKFVQNIVVGDKLMGDDSTERNVERLWRGQSDMWKVIPERGESFIVNGSHKISLKITSLAVPTITDNVVKYLTLVSRDDVDGDRIKKNKMVFKTNAEAVEYFNEIQSNTFVLKLNDIVDIQVKHYLEMEDCNLVLYRPDCVEFQSQEIDKNPYDVGVYLIDDLQKYKLNTVEVRKYVLAGILDTYGKYQNNVYTVSNTLVNDDIIFIARSLGISAYQTNDGVMIYGKMLNDLPCKINYTHTIDDEKIRFKIEKEIYGDYFGVQVDSNHRYLMYDFLVTRNSNGKSKIVELFQHTIGDYACIFNVSMLTQKRVSSSATNSELAIAKGKRFAILQEPEENERLNVGLMKELTGGDQIQCRCLFKEPIRFKPMFKMILTCNHMPSIPPDDGGTWRRVRRVEYTSKFVDTPNPNNEHEFIIDRELGYKFELWKETFMAMLLRYYKIYKKKGKIVEPKEVMEYTYEYQRKNDIFADFCDMYITEEAGASVDVTSLFEKFKEYCQADNIKNKAKKSTFQEAMEKRYGKLVKVKTMNCWKGIRLIEKHMDEDEDNEIHD